MNWNILAVTKRFKKLAFFGGILGASTLISLTISLPILAQLYPPYYLFQPYASSNYPYRNEEGDLVDTLSEASNFVNLAAELEEAGLAETLKQQSFTIFAPTDEAFEALPDDVFDKFIQPENRIKVLKYHLVAGEVSQEDVDTGAVTTLEGSEITISHDNGNVRLNEANAKHPSTRTSNGVIIEIDRVLFPPGF